MTKMTSYFAGLILFTIMALGILWAGAENKKKKKIPNWAIKLCLFIFVILALLETANIIFYLVRH